MRKKYRVRKNTDTTPLSLEYLNYPPGQKRLQGEHLTTPKPFYVCLCNTETEPFLYIRRAPKGSYGLARYPGTGHLHLRNCEHYEEEPYEKESSLVLSHSAIKMGSRDDGTPYIKSIRMAHPVRRTEPQNNPDPDEFQKMRKMELPKNKYVSLGNVGFLHHIWSLLKLNYWNPDTKPSKTRMYPTQGDEPWDYIGRWLSKSLEGTLFNGVKGKDCLLIPRKIKGDFAKDTVFRRNDKYPVVIGEISSVDPGPSGGFYVSLVSLADGYLFIPLNTWNGLTNSCRLFWTILQKKVLGKIVLAGNVSEHAIKAGKKVYTVQSCGVMPVTDMYIPVDSSHEISVANKLVNEKRIFSKPLRYDLRDLSLWPDFVLHDLLLEEKDTRTAAMEVWGMKGMETYDTRKAEKEALYADKSKSQYKLVWEWDGKTPMRPFPPKQ